MPVSIPAPYLGRARANRRGIPILAQEIASQATITAVDREWISARWAGHQRSGNHRTRRSCAGGSLQRPRHYCVAAAGKNRLGTRADVALAGRTRSCGADFARWEYAGQNSAAARLFTQVELDATADFLNRIIGLDTGSDPQRPFTEAGHRARALRRHRAERPLVMRSCGAGRRIVAARSR